MKKLIFYLFFIVSIISFSEKTCNDTDFRQAMVNYANSQVGKPYSMSGPRVGPTSFDCSGLMSASIKAGGMTSISGKSGDFGTTASGLVNGSGTLIPKNDFSSLKPGDMVHFSPYSSRTTGHVGIVVANLGNGKVEIVDARGREYGVVRRVVDLRNNSNYLGATSATQILKNNGCTNIVDENGQVVVPPAGITTNGIDETQKIIKRENYYIDLDKNLRKYVNAFNKIPQEIGYDLIIILTYIMAIFFIYDIIKNKNNNLDVIFIDFLFELFKFVFFVILINNFHIINNTAINLIFEVAKAFGSTLSDYYVLNDIAGYYAQNVGLLAGEFARQSIGFNALINMATFNLSIYVILTALILYTTLIFTYIIFQMVRAVITYAIGTNFSLILLPGYFNRYVAQYIPNPFSIFFKSLAQLFFSVVIISISMNILKDLSGLLESYAKSYGVQIWFINIDFKKFVPAFDVLALTTYATAYTLIALIMRKTLKTITNLI